jgi:tripartite-type tricarboxylate transporter receptor subunit TctC
MRTLWSQPLPASTGSVLSNALSKALKALWGALSAASLPLLFSVFCALPSFAQAQQSYPVKPIRLVIPFPAGGATDILGRALSQKLGEKLGQSIVIDNKPGAGGTIGSQFVAAAAADGYTLLLATSSTHSIGPVINPKISYQVETDFTPLAFVATSPTIIIVPQSSPAKNLSDLVALAKAKPGQLNYASSGNGTIIHLQTELFKAMSGTFITHIPYRGTALAIPDLISGKIDVMFDALVSGLPHVKDGKVRALAITTPKRSALAPDLPSANETIKGYAPEAWFGLYAPKGLSPDLVQRINLAVNAALQDSEVKERFARLGGEPAGGTAQAFASMAQADRAAWRKVIAEKKIATE